MRIWDYRTSNGVDEFITNSHFVARRIQKAYRRDATVIHPPVDTETFTPGGAKQNFYVTASRLVPYKRMDLVVEAFAAMPHRRLVVIGDGPETGRIAAKAGSNIALLGHQPQTVLRDHLQKARAFVFAAVEDFGIAPVEALACGTPVIAYGKGGAVETIEGSDHRSPTGVFFYQQSVAAIQEAVEQFEREETRFSPVACRNGALRFGVERFRLSLKDYLDRALERFARRRRERGPDRVTD
jgi:glycosyltransferase involved in cell wall biosynthesis